MPTLREDLVNYGIKNRVYLDRTGYGPYLVKNLETEDGRIKLKVVYPPNGFKMSATNYTLPLENQLDDLRASPHFAGSMKRTRAFQTE